MGGKLMKASRRSRRAVAAMFVLCLPELASGAPGRAPARTPTTAAPLRFTPDEVSRLYETCLQSGGSATMAGGEISCQKTGPAQKIGHFEKSAADEIAGDAEPNPAPARS